MRLGVLFFVATLPFWAQTRTPSIRASGEGSVSAVPDVVRINLTITNQAMTAQEAAEQNAAISLTVTNRVKALLATNGETRTVSYSVSPNYRSNTTGGQTLVGFSASNTLEVTAFDLNLAGRLVDAAAQAGATSVSGLRFGLKDSEPQRREALKRATQVARTSAGAIAEGLSVRLGPVLEAHEGTIGTFFNPADARAGGAAAATSFDTGLVEVRATVTLEFAIAP